MSIAINKKVKFDGARSPFSTFCVSKVITTAHAHKSGVIFHLFPRAFKQTKKLRLYNQRWLKLPQGGGGPALKTSSLAPDLDILQNACQLQKTNSNLNLWSCTICLPEWSCPCHWNAKPCSVLSSDLLSHRHATRRNDDIRLIQTFPQTLCQCLRTAHHTHTHESNQSNS